MAFADAGPLWYVARWRAFKMQEMQERCKKMDKDDEQVVDSASMVFQDTQI